MRAERNPLFLLPNGIKLLGKSLGRERTRGPRRERTEARGREDFEPPSDHSLPLRDFSLRFKKNHTCKRSLQKLIYLEHNSGDGHSLGWPETP